MEDTTRKTRLTWERIQTDLTYRRIWDAIKSGPQTIGKIREKLGGSSPAERVLLKRLRQLEKAGYARYECNHRVICGYLRLGLLDPAWASLEGRGRPPKGVWVASAGRARGKLLGDEYIERLHQSSIERLTLERSENGLDILVAGIPIRSFTYDWQSYAFDEETRKLFDELEDCARRVGQRLLASNPEAVYIQRYFRAELRRYERGRLRHGLGWNPPRSDPEKLKKVNAMIMRQLTTNSLLIGIRLRPLMWVESMQSGMPVDLAPGHRSVPFKAPAPSQNLKLYQFMRKPLRVARKVTSKARARRNQSRSAP